MANPIIYARPGQNLEPHLKEVAEIARRMGLKIGLPTVAYLIGLVHDIGKYSDEFVRYMDRIIKKLPVVKGSVDHATAGGQLIWKTMPLDTKFCTLLREVTAICCVSHHMGCPIDCLDLNGENVLNKRLESNEAKSHYAEVLSKLPPYLLKEIETLLKCPQIRHEIEALFLLINPKEGFSEIEAKFYWSMTIRFLLSCLIEGDHSSASLSGLKSGNTPDWDSLSALLEQHLQTFTNSSHIDKLRGEISQSCLEKAELQQGQYLLTLPTGGGKTLASLRFGLAHAKHHHLDRIIYVVPYTSIIEQNAKVARKILGDAVLEHHSNFVSDPKEDDAVPDEKAYLEAIVNWDAPVVFTTMVQFLHALFKSGSSNVRRMHALARSVIIFDEIQAIPLHVIHLFNNAVNYLTKHASSTAVFCTATQPCLNLTDKKRGALRLEMSPHLVERYSYYLKEFSSYRQVKPEYREKKPGWRANDIALLAQDQAISSGSTLVIVNTKRLAKQLFDLCQKNPEIETYHLSTNMCPAHRLEVIQNRIDKKSLEEKRRQSQPIICISTQLVEAGVDLDFDVVIRSLAGMDSISQAAGRCNRDGKRPHGRIILINPLEEVERITKLKPIKIGRDISEKLLSDYKNNHDLLGEAMMDEYFRHYLDWNSDKFSYNATIDDHEVTLLDLLSNNRKGSNERNNFDNNFPLSQAFRTASQEFAVIEDDTLGVLVPYGKGREIIEEFRTMSYPKHDEDWERINSLLKQSQQYSVNIHKNLIDNLTNQKYIAKVCDFLGIFHVYDHKYDHLIQGCGFLSSGGEGVHSDNFSAYYL